MPKILIKEFDRSSPGTPGNYANYAVLIAGYAGKELSETDPVKPDSNGVFEFSSAGDFEKTIGIAEAKKTIDGAEEGPHYGNSMAYELLNLGYTVIYKVINSIRDMADENFWAIFKDKASYDFRFISHGLLETNCDEVAYKAAKDRLATIEADIKKFNEITAEAEATEGFANLDPTEQTAKYEEVFANSGYDFLNNKGKKYDTYSTAKSFLGENENGDVQALVEQKNNIANHDNNHITEGTFNTINGIIAKLASYRIDKDGNVLNDGRGDCIALIELAESCYVNISSTDRPETLIANGIKNMSSSIGEDGAYCALTVPSVYYNMSGEIKKFPGAFHYLSCFMGSLSSGFAEWYAAAGYNRGVSSYVIDHTSVKLGEIAINVLEPRYLVDDESKVQPPFACNVIANFRGSHYLWGNRTAEGLLSEAGGGDLKAHHFLNIRQLCTTIKKQLYVACRRFTFDPNSDTLWFNFVNAITPTLDAMKADQGIRDYKVIKVFTDKKATMKAKIRIIPIEAVEDFDIEISLEDSFGGVSVNAN